MNFVPKEKNKENRFQQKDKEMTSKDEAMKTEAKDKDSLAQVAKRIIIMRKL